MCAASRLQLGRALGRPLPPDTESGAVLLEVVLALALFVGAAAVLTSGLTSSLDAVERLRFNTHAANLAVSVLSELQMGIKTQGAGGPQPFEAPLENWSWEVVTSPQQAQSDETSSFQRVEVIIRREESDLVFRLGQVLRLEDSASEAGTSGLSGAF